MLARNIPGNAAVVKHEVTGLLFSDPQVREVGSPGSAHQNDFRSAVPIFSPAPSAPLPPAPPRRSPVCRECPRPEQSDSASNRWRGLEQVRSPMRDAWLSRFQSGHGLLFLEYLLVSRRSPYIPSPVMPHNNVQDKRGTCVYARAHTCVLEVRQDGASESGHGWGTRMCAPGRPGSV